MSHRRLLGTKGARRDNRHACGHLTQRLLKCQYRHAVGSHFRINPLVECPSESRLLRGVGRSFFPNPMTALDWPFLIDLRMALQASYHIWVMAENRARP